MGGRDRPDRIARVLLVVVAGLGIVLASGGATPVQAARQTTLTINFFTDGNHGDGKGTVTADVGSISCSFDTGFKSGTCQHTYVYLDAWPLDVELTYTPATGSYACMVGATVCHPDGSTRKLVVRLDGQASTTVAPSFNLRSYTLQVGVTGPGIVTSTDGTLCTPAPGMYLCRLIKHGKTATLNAVPSAGSHFSYWSFHCATAAPTCTLTVTGNMSVSATFGYWQVRAYRDAGGDVCAPSIQGLCTEGLNSIWVGVYVAGGATLGVEARPKPGYRFDGWQPGPCAGQPATCSIGVSGDTDLIARFALIATPAPVPTASPTPKPPATATPRPSATAGPTSSVPPTPTAPPSAAAPTDASAPPPSSPDAASPDPATTPPPTEDTTPSPGDGATGAPQPTPAATPAPSAAPVASPAEGSGVLLPALVVLVLVVAAGSFLLGRRARRA